MRFGRFRNFNIEGSLKVQRLLFFEWFYCKDGIVFLKPRGYFINNSEGQYTFDGRLDFQGLDLLFDV